MEIYTIGFTATSAENFFNRLDDAHIERLLDVRLNNTSQLAAFAKAQDLRFFAKRLIGASYEHEPLLAPTQDLLDAYKKHKGSWEDYERSFLALMAELNIDETLRAADFERRTALLCSEPTAGRCHRRLVAEFLARHWPDVRITHL
jgi:uncharacterized protein (DUF488 family)